MKGVDSVELHAGHHTVVQWLGMSFNMDTLINTWITMAVVIIVMILATRKRSQVPSGVQNVVEAILETLQGQLEPNLGKHWTTVSSLLFTFFLFIFVGNEIGLLPTNHAISSPTADLNTALGLSVITTISVWVIGIRVKGIGFFKHFVQPNPAFLPVNLFEEVGKTVTLAFRLFGNILAGEILLEVLYFLLPSYVPLAWIWIGFSLFVGLIQAFIFTVLTTAYIGMGVNEEH